MAKRHRIVAIANSKGGVGKSTLATNLAAYAAGAGVEVLLVDTDPQSSAAIFAASRAEDRPAFRLIQMSQPILHRELPKLAEPYDLVIVDTGARDTKTFRSALAAADMVIIPITPSAYDVWASEGVFTLVDELSTTRDLSARVVLNQVVPRTRVAREALEALEEMVAEQGAGLLDTRVHSRVAWKMASSHGLAVTEYEPKGAAASELRTLWAELDLLGQ